MGEPLPEKQYYSREEYLEMEEFAEYKSEYYNGEIFTMSGGTPNHSTICFNLIGELRESIRRKGCRGFDSNMKLEIPEANTFVYPDVMIVCGKIELAENRKDVIRNPLLIIEVLSPSTESFDRGKKFEYYRTLPSLKEYVLASQDKPMIEVYSKEDENKWQYFVSEGLKKTVFLQSLEYEIALKDVYLEVEWEK